MLLKAGQLSIEMQIYSFRSNFHFYWIETPISKNALVSGAAAMMAIRILLDHDVPEENIYVLSLLMSEPGVHALAYAFPKVGIVIENAKFRRFN